MYADYEYYTESFLFGRDEVVPDDDWEFFEKQARYEIDLLTHNRIASLDEIPEAVKDCTCAVTELLYNADQQAKTYKAQGLAGPLASWSNDGQSGSVDLGQSAFTETGKRRETYRLALRYLSGTGLLYAGVMVYEP